VNLVGFIIRIRLKRFMQVDYGLMLLVPRLRMSGALPLLRLYAFMAWTGETTFFVVSWVLTSCSFVSEYRCFGERAASIFKVERSGTSTQK
jgi:hypothetical protein